MRNLIFAALFALAACGPAPTVELSQPPVAPKPQKPNSTDTTPAPEPGGPVTQPTPIPPPSLPVYRAICEDRSLGNLQTVSSVARPTAGVSFLRVSVTDRNGVTRKVVDAKNPVALESKTPDHIQVLYEGASELSVGTAGAPRLLLATIDLSLRQGTGEEVGAKIAIDSAVRELAKKLGIETRNYGSSDKGTYFIVPRAKAFEVIETATRKTVAVLAFAPGRTLAPQIFEEAGVFTALVHDGGVFKLAIVELALSGTDISVVKSTSIAPLAGRSASEPAWFGPKTIVWSEAALGRDGVATSLALSTYSVGTQQLVRAEFRSSLATSRGVPRMVPRIAVIGAPAKPRILVASEIAMPRAGGPISGSLEIETAQISVVALVGAQAFEESRIDYPVRVIEQTKIRGFEGPFILEKIVAPSGAHEAIFEIGNMLYKDRGGQLDNVGALHCANPSVVGEVP